jgi:predicted alpha/beta-fold hydrolase
MHDGPPHVRPAKPPRFAPPAYAPPRLLRNGHLQTLFPYFLRRPRRPAPVVEEWGLPDGEAVAVYLVEATGAVRARPGLLVVHGLEGSAESQYVRGLMGRAWQAGWNTAAFDLRSCGPGGRARVPTRTAYHAGKSEDVAAVVQRLGRRWAGPLAVVGFSLGGNLLLKWLGETGAEAPVAAAVAVSAPFDLAACAAAIDGGGFWSGLYRGSFIRSLRRKALAMARAEPRLDAVRIAACRTFAAFDEEVTARLNGFAGAHDYWARCSAGAFLAGIRRPTLLIAAEDDPIVPAACIPRAAIAANPALTLWAPAHGGHVGFVGGSLRRPVYAAEEAIVAYLGPLYAAHLAANMPRPTGATVE